MLRGSPFHSRTTAACQSWEWKAWSGYLAASSYSVVPYMEYYAIRHSAGLIDVSPLYKYRIRGKDAPLLLNKVYPCHEVVKVDYHLQGCPPPADTIWAELTALLGNKPLQLPYELIKYD